MTLHGGNGRNGPDNKGVEREGTENVAIIDFERITQIPLLLGSCLISIDVQGVGGGKYKQRTLLHS